MRRGARSSVALLGPRRPHPPCTPPYTPCTKQRARRHAMSRLHCRETLPHRNSAISSLSTAVARSRSACVRSLSTSSCSRAASRACAAAS